MENIRYPDYENSILNLINSILKYYNVETNHSSLSILDEKFSAYLKVIKVDEDTNEIIYKNEKAVLV